MSIYSYAFGIIVACASYIAYQKYVNTYPSIISRPEKRYDYIIVGAGTAGCVLASRLSEDPNTKVLLVEAGDHMGYFTKIPLTPTAAQQGASDWSVRTTPQNYSSFGLWEQTQILPRGKGLGGSGQINFLLHGFGLPQDYETWSRLGFKGWTLEDLKPYFMKAFGTVRSEFDTSHCSLDGYCPGSKRPMQLKQIDEQNELLQVFKRASDSTKDPSTLFRKPTATVKNGARHGTLDGYLKPALGRKNLHVLLRTQGVSIHFEKNKALSLFILQNHRQLDNIFVNKEIILSAGTIKTPQILFLSGIGPKDLLQRLRIPLISENDHVGQNVHDHMNIPIYVSLKKPVGVTLAKVFTFGTVWDYLWNKRGLLSFPPVSGVEYHNGSAVMLFSMGTASERLLRDLSNYRPKVFRATFPFYNDSAKEGFMFLATCPQPRSRGMVTLADISTAVPVVVDPGYLRETEDVRCMVQAIRRAERLISTKPFREIGAKIHWPRAERCQSFWRYSKEEQIGTKRRQKRQSKEPYTNQRPPDEYLECIVREVAVTGHHISGSCAGGKVVDEQLRVKSVSGVRIVDASVFPAPVSLYPNSVLVAVAERAADLIRNFKLS